MSTMVPPLLLLACCLYVAIGVGVASVERRAEFLCSHLNAFDLGAIVLFWPLVVLGWLTWLCLLLVFMTLRGLLLLLGKLVP